MNNKKRNIIQFNRDIKINAATCIIAAIFLYVIISVIIASKKEPITTYRVNKTNVSNNIILDGLIIRDEKLVNTTKSGYVCYYIRDGEKVKRFSPVCTLDETGQIYNQVSDSETYENLLTKEDYNDIRSLISLYKVNYNDTDFYNAYKFESNANNKVLELTNEIIMQQVSGNKESNNMSTVTSPYSGIITYYTDGFEGYTLSQITQSDFDQSAYNKQTLKTGDIVSNGTPVVKIVPNENWNIVARITSDEIASISSSDYVRIRINNSSNTIVMPYEILNNSDGSYINIKLDKYMSNYLSERYVNVEIVKEEDIGLKVPVTSIVEKEVYKIPTAYFTGGGNQNYSNKLNIQVMGDDGQVTIKQVSPNIYMSDDEYKYVDPSVFSDTDVLINITNNETCAISLISRDSIKGVYTANRGIAEFVRVDIIKIIDDFALVDSTGSLKVYDNIVLDSDTVNENQIIY